MPGPGPDWGSREILAVPHFHFDFEWWKSLEGYAEDVKEVIRGALGLLDARPDFRFTVDGFYAARLVLGTPDEARFRRHLKDGRIEIVGNTICGPDENMPTAEGLIRQLLLVRRKFRDTFGAWGRVAWMIDEFGHSVQMPQIFRKAGMDAFSFARGIPHGSDHPADFWWEAPDGSRVLTHWMATHYMGFSPFLPPPLGATFAEEAEFVARFLAPRCPGPLFLPMGTDFTVPSAGWIEFWDRWNREADGRPKARFALPSDYFRALEPFRERLPVVRGEFNPLFEGCYESREGLKKKMRATAHLLLEAERWNAVAQPIGVQARDLDGAWEEAVANDAHDVGCGTITDPLAEKAEARYRRAAERGRGVLEEALAATAARADTRGPGRAHVVFNSLPWKRTLPVEFPGSTAAADAGGAPLPAQPVAGGLLVEVEAPPLGFRVLHRAGGTVPPPAAGVRAEASGGWALLENDRLRVEVDPLGNVAVEGRGGPRLWGNRLRCEEDLGNLWVIRATGLRFGPATPAGLRVVESGPLRAVVEATGSHPHFEWVKRVILHRGSRVVEFETDIRYTGRSSRVTVEFDGPTGPATLHEVPYGAVERGPGIWPVQNWAAADGWALLNRGIPSVQTGPGRMALGLMRSVEVLPLRLIPHLLGRLPAVVKAGGGALAAMVRGYNRFEDILMPFHHMMLREFASAGPGFEAKGGITIPDHFIPAILRWKPSTAWERGLHRFHYALAVGAAPEELPRLGLEFQHPPRVVAAEPHAGDLGAEHSFGNCDETPVLWTVLRRDSDGRWVARLVNMSEKAVTARPSFFRRIARAEKVALTEEEVYGPVPWPEVPLGPWEIATVRMVEG